MPTLPTGTVTFLFTDIEGSTYLLQLLGERRYAQALADHRRLLRTAFEAASGHEIETQGDGFLVAFQRARDAVLAAVAAQRAITAHPWPDVAVVRVRMGLHTGEPISTPEGYVGLDVHRAARICAAGHGGQILLSATTRSLLGDDLPEGLSLRDLSQHRLKDLTQPQRLFQVVTADLSADFPALKSLSVLPNNLPRQLSSFIGREREIAEVKRTILANRLLTLTGSGGCGKTRLALQVAAELLEQFRDGVWWVELAALSDKTLVPQTVASALSVHEEPGRSLLPTLTSFLRHKSLLLVLDNCEHLLPDCAELVETLLRVCPDLRIMATSREALRIVGEVRWRIPSLSLPDLHHPLPAERLTQYEAIQLFLERARAALPAFTVTAQNALTVAQVCHRLDGIPLAIEMAAARVRVLAVEQIAKRLDDRFGLLTGWGRTAPPRQQTLLSAMDWSHDLLLEKERIVFRRLAIFAGGFTLEAVEATCAGETIEVISILDLLTQLVDKSLVVVEEMGGEVRYRLLETVRQYGHDRLDASGESATVRRRHQEFFLTLAERAEPGLRGPEQAAWLERLEVEHDNLRAALEWSRESHEAESMLRLTGSLWRFWYVRGYYSEGRGWLEESLRTSSGASPALGAMVLGGAGYLATYQLDYSAALAFLEESLALRRQLGDRLGIADSLHGLGRVASRQGDFKRAAALFGEALALFTELRTRDGIAMALNSLGLLAGYQGDYATARSLLQESLAIDRELGDRRGIAFAAGNLGVIALRQGDYAAARVLLKESLAIDRELGDKRGSISELEELGLLAAAQGQAERAARLLGAAEALREATSVPPSSSERAFYDYDRHVAVVSAMLGHDHFATAWAHGRAMTLEQSIEYAMREDA